MRKKFLTLIVLFIFSVFLLSFVSAIPTEFDWRNYNGHNWVSPVKNQGSCASDWAVTVADVIESKIMINKNDPSLILDLSEQQLVSCGPSGANGCNGGAMQTALNYIKINGLVYETAFPYFNPTPTNVTSIPTCLGNINTIMPRAKIESFVSDYYTTDINLIKQKIVDEGPIIGVMEVYDDFNAFMSYGGDGIYSHVSGSYLGKHAIVLVGYNDAGQYWIVKNTWGTGWGDHGFFKMSYTGGTLVLGINGGVISIGRTDYNGDGMWDLPTLNCYGIEQINSSVCSGHGSCIATDTCSCNSGWSGSACDTPLCNPLCNHGTCTAPNTCTCSSGWNGSTCDNPVAPTCNPLCNHGSCIGSGCSCESGWTGATCNTPVYAGGNGSSSNPFQITNCNELQNINNDLDANYILTNDIDCSATTTWNSGAGFVPVGIFTGTLDGKNHTITGLFINRPYTNQIGLFNSIESGVMIKNVGLINVEITGGRLVGGLVGQNNYGVIENSYSTGSITSSATENVTNSGEIVGGLVGSNHGTITNSYSAGNVIGGSYVGGLVGYSPGEITNSYATGSVRGNKEVGGLVGSNYEGIIESSYSTGIVTGGDFYIGGLVGWNEQGNITNSYSTGSVSGSFNVVGGLVGFNYGGIIESSYSTGNVSGNGYNIGGLVGYNSNPGKITNSYSTGNIISNGGNYVGGLVGMNEQGTIITNSYSTGSVIDSGSYSSYVGGLVGLNKGTITNSYVTGSVTGSISVGGLVGQNDGIITNSSSTGNIISSDSISVYAGGLVGFNEGTIINSYSTGNIISSGTSVGGLVGHNKLYGTITNSYSTGSVNGRDTVGGLVGGNREGIITNSYSTGSVNGRDTVGGLVGWNGMGIITNSYSTGNVTGNIIGSASVGGLVGASTSGTVTNSYWDIETSEQTTSSGGTGKTTAEMKTQFTFVGWDFTDVWTINACKNEGYPYLQWQVIDSADSGATEICNGIDDDCDGLVDEDYVPTLTTCGIGACSATGQLICSNGATQNTCAAGNPTAETCDGIDNDCNGFVDNELTIPSQSCNVGTGACMRTGTQIKTCNGASGWSNWGTCSATPGTPTPETCNNIDDDCDGTTDEFYACTWTGFFQPVDNIPTLNQVNSGRAIPLKFSLGGDMGLNIFTTGYPVSQKIACNLSAPLDIIETTLTAGGSSLSYDPITKQYNYVWKTDKAWSGTCRQLTIKLSDGTVHYANFKFTK